MIDIKEALDKIFTYERDEHPAYKELIAASDRQPGNEFSNLWIERPDLGFKGFIPFLGNVGRGGNTLAYYSSERAISREIISGKRLPENYVGISDCAFTHMGVLMNCLAYLTGQTISRLCLVRVYDTEVFDVGIKPMIAEKFMGEIKKNHKAPKCEQMKATGRRNKKHANIDRNQAAIFS